MNEIVTFVTNLKMLISLIFGRFWVDRGLGGIPESVDWSAAGCVGFGGGLSNVLTVCSSGRG